MKRAIFISVLFLIFSVTASAAITKIDTLGQSPFYGWVEDVETARMVVKNNLGAVKYALNMLYGLERGNKIFFALCEQIDEAKIGEIHVKPGQEMEFMLFKSRGFQRVLQNARWIGKESFKAFWFYLDYKYKRYFFVVPQICGNISLLSVSNIVRIQETEEETDIGESIKIELTEPKEKLIPAEITSSRKSNVFNDIAAGMVRSCYGKYLPVVRLGLEYSLSRSFSLVGTVGAAMPLQIKQRNTWEPFVIADLSFRYKFRRLSLGLGAGFSSQARKGHVPGYGETLVNLGFNLSKSVMVFFETRIPLTQIDDIKYFPNIAHKFILGIRYSPDKK